MQKFLFSALFLLMSLGHIAQAQPVPEYQQRVTDLTHTLSAAQTNHIEQLLSNLEQNKGSQVAVLIVPTTQPDALEDYSLRVVEKWKLGRKDIDDGVLLLIAQKDRKIRIEVGYGLEGAITDISAGRIINEYITPEFRRGNFYAGILAGTGQIANLINGESLPPPTTNQGYSQGLGNASADPFGSTIMLMVFGAFASFFSRAFLGRLTTFILISGGGALTVWLMTADIFLTIFAAIFLGLFSLADANGSGSSSYRDGGGYGGGFGGGGGSSGGGFSGGGGGGGGFGGGGASGGW